jgi:hypothetical protein
MLGWWGEEKSERERERVKANNGLHCIILRYIRMDTRASLYRREREALASNLTNVR